MPSPGGRDLLFALFAVLALVSSFAAAMLVRADRRRRRIQAEERRLASMGLATARILHQVKNPLQTIVLHADLLRDAVAVPDTTRSEAAGAIAAEAQRLSAMLGEISAYASGATRTFDRRPLALHELLRELAAREARDPRMEVVASEIAECTVPGDAYYLRQVFENLIANAREAMKGIPRPRMTLALACTPGAAEVSITDTGPGIAPERAEAVFHPFVSGKTKGMGLGLTIAREIVERHGGRIEMHSPADGGCSFRVVLPVEYEVSAAERNYELRITNDSGGPDR